MGKREFQIGDPVIFRVRKFTSHPGPRAQRVTPAPRGEFYEYEVDKFWVVAEVREDGRLRLLTRRGKEHVVDPDDPRLRRARWWERCWWRHKFPTLSELEGECRESREAD
jgi:hypothetical protein